MRKVSFLCMIVLGVFFTACNTDEEPWGDWSKSSAYPGDYRVLAVSFQDGDNVYVGMGYNERLSTSDKYLRNFYKFDGTSWTSVAGNFPGLGREGCVAFVIGDIAYVGAGYRKKQTGNISDTYFSDFYQFDLTNDTWMKDGNDETGYARTDIVRNSDPLHQIAGDDSVSSQFWSGVGFELGGKGYAGTGKVDGRTSKSMFCYNPTSETWTMKAMEGDPRAGGVVFKIGKTAIVCLGSDGSRNNTGVDFLEEGKEEWGTKAPLVDLVGDWNNNYNEIPRNNAVAFTSDLHEKLYGYIAGGNSNTVWRYSLEDDRWREVEEFSMAMPPRVGGVGFSIKGVGYITTGGSSLGAANNNSTWEYIPGTDEDDTNDY